MKPNDQVRTEVTQNGELESAFEVKCLIFEWGQQNYGLATDRVLEIAPFQELSPIPGRTEEFMGYLNLRGELIPVMQPHIFNSSRDLQSDRSPQVSSLEEPRANAPLRCLVILSSQNKTIALPVSRVIAVEKVNLKEVQDLQWGRNEQQLKMQIFLIKKKPMFLLNADDILNFLGKKGPQAA